MMRNTLPAIKNRVNGVSGMPERRVMKSSTGRARERINIAAAASSHATEYSTRICARRTEISTRTKSTTLRTLVTFKRLSIGRSAGRIGFYPVPPPIEFQDIDEHAEQDMRNVIQRFHCGNGRPPSSPRAHFAGYFFEPETPALQHYQGLDLGIFQREAAAEYIQRAPIHADESGS